MAHGDPRLLLAPDPTLLVIEDTTEHAILVRVAARRAFPGLDVRVAGGGREGIAYLAGSAPFQDRGFHAFPDLVILDLLMPDIDGFGVLEWIRDRKNPKPLPVVILRCRRRPSTNSGRSRSVPRPSTSSPVIWMSWATS